MSISKENILEAWIMVEHLSEGEINVDDKSLLVFKDNSDRKFYEKFCGYINEIPEKYRKNSGIIMYFDIFDFREVIDIIRDMYSLQPTNEDIQIGYKFGFSLCFDCSLALVTDNLFMTESSYIRSNKKIPRQKEFNEFEEMWRQYITQQFDGTASNPEKFNAAIEALLLSSSTLLEKCRVQIVKDMTNQNEQSHSFFIDDLEKAKNISTKNLQAYLYGYSGCHVNLNSKSSSDNFAPDTFKKILSPKHYPLGRFPSNTKYALSLMQQTAVNLASGFDTETTIRSVNGPPGTGKTTLLKDVFAHLVVTQAYHIATRSEKQIKGTEKTVYYRYKSKKSSIGVLPDNIAENNIVVASSNNGAVQNIVNELPLASEIDEALLNSLKQADYFRDLANCDISGKWIKDSSGKKSYKTECSPRKDGKEFWGLFSLEGGRSDNMNKIKAAIQMICEELNCDYSDYKHAYSEFLNQYIKVSDMRSRAQKYMDDINEVSILIERHNIKRVKMEEALNNKLSEFDNEIQRYENELKELNKALDAALSDREEAVKNTTEAEKYVQIIHSQKTGLLGFLGLDKKHRENLNNANKKMLELSEKKREVEKAVSDYDHRITKLKEKLNKSISLRSQYVQSFNSWLNDSERKINEYKDSIKLYKGGEPLDMTLEYDELQLSNPWFSEQYRIEQSKLFIAALKVRKQFLFENKKNLKAAAVIWFSQNKYADDTEFIRYAWDWINLAIPVISSTFASFHRMCKLLGSNSLGHLFIDEAGQALPQASIGAIFRSRHVMAVGDPSQIKPVMTLDSNVMNTIITHFGVGEEYLSYDASTQTLVDSASKYGYYRDPDCSEESWIGVPLWVHRRCRYPMFTISNVISYDGMMVQGETDNPYGKAGWFDIGGSAVDKYVEAQGDFLLKIIAAMAKEDPSILNKSEKDKVYVISPFANVAKRLAEKLNSIGFTRYKQKKPSNVGTIHTFQGKEAPVVFMVLGADNNSKGSASWAVSEANMMNVAATRAKKEFYIIGDKSLYLSLGSDVANDTNGVIEQYAKKHPELVVRLDDMHDQNFEQAPYELPQSESTCQDEDEIKFDFSDSDDELSSEITEEEFFEYEDEEDNKSELFDEASSDKAVQRATPVGQASEISGAKNQNQTQAAQVSTRAAFADSGRVTGRVNVVKKGNFTYYAYIIGDNNVKYTVNETMFSQMKNAAEILKPGHRISFTPRTGKYCIYADNIEAIK